MIHRFTREFFSLKGYLLFAVVYFTVSTFGHWMH